PGVTSSKRTVSIDAGSKRADGLTAKPRPADASKPTDDTSSGVLTRLRSARTTNVSASSTK
ncbi:hypothetical protein, partial [uncultured Corynebacterium sp.]|uniref:hypothetical protein n=1 Tax=uncultured Corynebacterium sp. TaxID=159447 RepID=UPI0028043F49